MMGGPNFEPPSRMDEARRHAGDIGEWLALTAIKALFYFGLLFVAAKVLTAK
jgi:hypothetical protein